MPTSEQIRAFNEAVSALNEAEKCYQTALEDYRNRLQPDSLAVDQALVVRELAQLAVESAKLQLGLPE